MSLFDLAGGGRVEHATIAVMARSDLTVVRDLLADAGGLGDALLATQVSPATASTGARITARVDWSFEIVTRRRAFDHEGPVRDRMRRLASGAEAGDWLFVLTPDPPVPSWLASPDGIAEEVHGRIVWISFAWLATAIRDLLADPARLVDARSQVLLVELLGLYDADGLLDTDEPDEPDGPDGPDESTGLHDGPRPAPAVRAGAAPAEVDAHAGTPVDDTLVVGGVDSWSDFLDHAAYVLPAGRSMSPAVRYVAFHRRGRIMAVMPRVLACLLDVELTERGAARLRDDGHHDAAAVVTSLAHGDRHSGQVRTVLALSPASDPACFRLPGPIDDPGAAPPRLTRLAALTS